MTIDSESRSRTVRLETGLEMTFACRPLLRPAGVEPDQQCGTGGMTPRGSTAVPFTRTAKNTCVP